MNAFSALTPRFFRRDTEVVARSLLGQLLVHQTKSALLIGRIVETEAYLGPHDLASHSSKGRTARTEVMFGPPGYSYVFLIYGMHWCFNVVTGNGAAVLIRAVEPLEGIASRTDGPGRLTRAMGITRNHQGLLLNQPPLLLAKGKAVAADQIVTGPRIGVAYAKSWARKPLRYFEKGNPFVSRGK